MKRLRVSGEERRRERYGLRAKTTDNALWRLRLLDVEPSPRAAATEYGDGESLNEGHAAILLWRVATKLQISPERFEELLAAARSTE